MASTFNVTHNAALNDEADRLCELLNLERQTIEPLNAQPCNPFCDVSVVMSSMLYESPGSSGYWAEIERRLKAALLRCHINLIMFYIEEVEEVEEKERRSACGMTCGMSCGMTCGMTRKMEKTSKTYRYHATLSSVPPKSNVITLTPVAEFINYDGRPIRPRAWLR